MSLQSQQACAPAAVCLLRIECPKDLQRGKGKDITSAVILPSLAKTDETEASARRTICREVANHVVSFQAFVVVAAINDLPRSVASIG